VASPFNRRASVGASLALKSAATNCAIFECHYSLEALTTRCTS
jgi:hypothetical protein